jgi:hypothetical protein
MRRARAGRTFDAQYAASLSADAVPELVAGLPGLSPQDRRTLAKAMIERWSPAANPDWRSWTVASTLARQAVGENALVLRGAGAEASR